MKVFWYNFFFKKWIKKYGKQWKEIHAKEERNYSLFLERRRFRRFQLSCRVELIKTNLLYLANTVNINLFGLLCRTSDYLQSGTEICIRFLSQGDCQKSLICNGVVERAVPIDPRKYELFLRFDDYSQIL
ncbi:MAG: hypothetical protein NT066_06100 [Candidatus Omnitrophica bacterium]|nr:hypothetical protein [Candidatus Omnitrophota bacterium]